MLLTSSAGTLSAWSRSSDDDPEVLEMPSSGRNSSPASLRSDAGREELCDAKMQRARSGVGKKV